VNVHLASSDGFPAPFVRPAAPQGASQDDSRVVPDGWVVESTGLWRGGAAEVVYDPRRHDVMVTEGVGHDELDAALRADGWMRCAVEGRKGLWARDRLVAVRNTLARFDQAVAGAEPARLATPERPPLERPEAGRGLGL
jgi:hypothetical protein